ncbi:MAG TPA: zinc ribbon domain-containing protein [Coriobacteriia bacterium]
MGEFKFSDNYSDLCEETGTRAGFQFEFSCERCGDTFRSAFVPYKSGQAAEWLGRASGIFGGAFDCVADAVGGVSEGAFGVQRDKQFQEAIEQAEAHFHRCPRCTSHVCDTCWNSEAGLCLQCAPSAEVEVEAAYASGKVYAVGEKAANAGIVDGKHMDVGTRRQLVCPKCGAETSGAKFCPECGEKLAAEAHCTECGAKLADGAKFCGGCGAKVA